ncbi:MAG: VOC family protein [Kofleriaceae bacterium]
MTARMFRIILHVGDLDVATDIYAKLLGTPGRAVGGGRVYFDVGAMTLALLVNDGPPKSVPEYVYFAVDNLEEIHTIATELDVLAGDEIHGRPGGEIEVRPWRERSFYARDPWDNGLCFVDETTLFTGRR